MVLPRVARRPRVVVYRPSRKPRRFDFPVGKSVAGKYVVERYLGGGWEGEVYVIIEKATGTLIDLNDNVLTTLGEEYKDTATPDVGVGHCTVTQP